jgi:hypothetical protein
MMTKTTTATAKRAPVDATDRAILEVSLKIEALSQEMAAAGGGFISPDSIREMVALVTLKGNLQFERDLIIRRTFCS